MWSAEFNSLLEACLLRDQAKRLSATDLLLVRLRARLILDDLLHLCAYILCSIFLSLLQHPFLRDVTDNSHLLRLIQDALKIAAAEADAEISERSEVCLCVCVRACALALARIFECTRVRICDAAHSAPRVLVCACVASCVLGEPYQILFAHILFFKYFATCIVLLGIHPRVCLQASDEESFEEQQAAAGGGKDPPSISWMSFLTEVKTTAPPPMSGGGSKIRKGKNGMFFFFLHISLAITHRAHCTCMICIHMCV